MAANRVFLPQEALDVWLDAERITLDGEEMAFQPEGIRFRLVTAIRFMADLTESGDPQALIGKVKDLEQLAALGGEHCQDSVIFGDNAYQVAEGFVAEPVLDDALARAAAASSDPIVQLFLKSA